MAAPSLAPHAWSLPPEVEALRAVLRDFVDREVRPRIGEMERHEHIPDELLRQMGDLGFFGTPFPQQWGGAGMGELAFALVQEEVARAHASTALLVTASTGLAARLLHQFGDDTQKARWLRPLAQGRMVGAFCLTEPGGGSDVPAMRSAATREGDAYVLRGEKAFVTNGDRAGVFLVFAKTDPARGRDGISLFAVERDTPGVTLVRLEDKMGLRASATAQMHFDDVRVPLDHRIGEEHRGFTMALAALNCSRVGIAAMCLGVAREALDVAWRYAHDRAMFGGTLADQQVTQHAFADMEAEIYAVESMLYRTALRIEAGEAVEAEASICKFTATEAAQRVVDRALQMHGGAGYLRGAVIERLYRDIRIARIYEGANEVQRNNVYRVMRRRRHE